MAAENAKVGSWDDADFTEGGFFDDKDGTIIEAKAVVFDYAGQREAVCALHIAIRPDDAESDEDVRNEYYKIGDLSKFTPTANGENYAPVGTATSMNKNAKAALFLRSLKDKGFQLSKLNAGVSALQGLHCHFNIVPMPDVKTESGEVKKDLKILVVTKIHDQPAANGAAAKTDKPAAKKPSAAAKKADAPATTAAPSGAANVDAAAAELLTGVILGLLAEKGGKMPKTGIPPAVFAQVTDAGQRAACMKLLANQAWLGEGAEARGWDLNGGELSMPGM